MHENSYFWRVKIICLVFFTFVILVRAESQGLNNFWLLGYDSWAGVPYGGTTINFISGSANINYTPRPMNFSTTNADISDNNGNILFYTNGVYISNALNDTLSNGTGLNPSSYTNSYATHGLGIAQADLIIPFPSDSNRYYLFHSTIDGNGYLCYYLYYTIVDISLNGGLGGVVSKNNIILTDTLVAGGITSCKHANGRDWWIVCHQYNSNRYFKYLITPNGISAPYIQDIGKIMSYYGAGQTVFSPDGEKFVSYHADNDLDIMDFDRCSGDFSNCTHVTINDSAISAGVAFSPNSQVLYVSSTVYIYQYDLTSANISSTQLVVAINDSFASPNPPFYTTFYLAQLASDGKIYINTGNGTDYLHVINNPDSLGVNCDVCQHCIHLPTYNALTIPNYPNYFLGAKGGTNCDSLPTMTADNVNLLSVRIFPNPLNSNFLSCSYKTITDFGEISIYNVEGKKIKSYSLPRWSNCQNIVLPDIRSGIFLLKFISSEGVATTTFLKL